MRENARGIQDTSLAGTNFVQCNLPACFPDLIDPDLACQDKCDG